eukprot:880488-Prymnesium_polylepis.1
MGRRTLVVLGRVVGELRLHHLPELTRPPRAAPPYGVGAQALAAAAVNLALGAAVSRVGAEDGGGVRCEHDAGLAVAEEPRQLCGRARTTEAQASCGACVVGAQME